MTDIIPPVAMLIATVLLIRVACKEKPLQFSTKLLIVFTVGMAMAMAWRGVAGLYWWVF